MCFLEKEEAERSDGGAVVGGAQGQTNQTKRKLVRKKKGGRVMLMPVAMVMWVNDWLPW